MQGKVASDILHQRVYYIGQTGNLHNSKVYCESLRFDGLYTSSMLYLRTLTQLPGARLKMLRNLERNGKSILHQVESQRDMEMKSSINGCP